jgi:hypothetical protein
MRSGAMIAIQLIWRAVRKKQHKWIESVLVTQGPISKKKKKKKF